MNMEQMVINISAKELGLKLSSDDRKLLVNRFEVTESYLSHLFCGRRKAQRGKGLEVIELAKKLAEINKQKAALV